MIDTRIVTTAYRYRRTLVFGVAIAVASCSPVETYNRTDRATGQAFASRGDVMLRVDKRDEGFAELRYMGTNSAGQAVFRRTDVDIGASAPPATVGALPPDAVQFVQFALDPTLGRTITLQDHGVEILQFNPAGVQYRVW
jgi:hypothetical protein